MLRPPTYRVIKGLCCLCPLQVSEACHLSLPGTMALIRFALSLLTAFGSGRQLMLSCLLGFGGLGISHFRDQSLWVRVLTSVHMVVCGATAFADSCAKERNTTRCT